MQRAPQAALGERPPRGARAADEGRREPERPQQHRHAVEPQRQADDAGHGQRRRSPGRRTSGAPCRSSRCRRPACPAGTAGPGGRPRRAGRGSRAPRPRAASCRPSKAHALAGGRRPRQASAKTNAATTSAASAGRTLRPRPSSTHCRLVSGLPGTSRPRTNATAEQEDEVRPEQHGRPPGRAARDEQPALGRDRELLRHVHRRARERHARHAVDEAHAARLLPAHLDGVGARGHGHAQLAGGVRPRRPVRAVDA